MIDSKSPMYKLISQNANLILVITTLSALLLHIYSFKSQIGKYSITVRDCSNDLKGSKPTSYWKEEKYMNNTLRAKRAVTVLARSIKLRRGAAIIDMGSGYHQVKQFLPRRSSYIPVDIENRVPGSSTIICNLNEREFPFLKHKTIDAFLFLGSFEYIYDKISVLRLCRMRNAPIVMEYYFKGWQLDTFSWIAPLSPNVLRQAAKSVGYSTKFFSPKTLRFIKRAKHIESQELALVVMMPI